MSEYIEYFDKFKDMDPYLEINEDEWKFIKSTFPKRAVKESLAEVAMTYPLPYQDISKQDALKAFEELKGVHWYDLITEGEWFARNEYRWGLGYDETLPGGSHDTSQIYFRRINTGNEASNYFQQENRWSIDGTVAPGPARTWKNKKFMITLMGSAYSLKLDKINKVHLRSMIALRKYICSQFKPSIAKAIYDLYEPKRVLDFSAGWGDRLAGFYAANTTEFYLGIDPKRGNQHLYRKQANFYEDTLGFFENDKESEFLCWPAEDVDYSVYDANKGNGFDLVFTSPPYFSVERYSHDDTQSWIRYKTIDEWNENFLQKTLGKVWKTINPGGYLMVNISDVNAYSGGSKGWLSICDPMNDYVDTLRDSYYCGAIGMEMARRPNSKGIEDFEVEEATFAEPIWVWRKNK